MKIIKKMQLKDVIGGTPLALEVCQTEKIISPSNLDYPTSNVVTGLNAVVNAGANDLGFRGATIGLLLSDGNFIAPFGENCVDFWGR